MVTHTPSEQPVILIGAARSGTRHVRDVLAASSSLVPIEHDISFVWRRGNESLPHDELRTADATTPVVSEIRSRIDELAATRADQEVLEKTVSNTLRLEFVHAVYPAARFVVLTRGGREVIESSHRQWTAGADWRRWMTKLSTIGVADLPYLAGVGRRMVKSRLSSDKTPAIWGVRYDGIEADLAAEDLSWVVAHQWLHSLQRTEEALRNGVPAIVTRYEDMVADAAEVRRVAELLCLPDAEACVDRSRRVTRKQPAIAWENFLTAGQRDAIEPIIEEGEKIITKMQERSL